MTYGTLTGPERVGGGAADAEQNLRKGGPSSMRNVGTHFLDLGTSPRVTVGTAVVGCVALAQQRLAHPTGVLDALAKFLQRILLL